MRTFFLRILLLTIVININMTFTQAIDSYQNPEEKNYTMPTIKNEVFESNALEIDGTWQDAADYNIGDKVPFRLIGTIPTDIKTYNKYQYIFHCELSNAFSLDLTSINLYIGEQPISTKDYRVTTTLLSDKCNFEIYIDDIKTMARKANIQISKSTQIKVEYEAELLNTADIGQSGNSNTAFIEYSNDPQNINSTGNTEIDITKVFTYQIEVKKTDGENLISGANFELLKWNGSEYAECLEIISSPDQSIFSFTGLESGDYKLVETQAPSGYKAAKDLEFTIVGIYDLRSDQPRLTSLQIKQDGKIISEKNKPNSIFQISTEKGQIIITVTNKIDWNIISNEYLLPAIKIGLIIAIIVSYIFLQHLRLH